MRYALPPPDRRRQEIMENRTGYEIAVIGMAGVFPGAKNIDEFWNNLINGVESIDFLSDEELKENGIDPVTLPGNYVKCKGGFLKDKGHFDAAFFGYTPNEATIMEPQLRKLHECAWEALEDAGYNPESYPGQVGCYVGGADNFYWRSLSLVSGKLEELGEFVSRILIDRDFLATRLSYRLNLKGPAVFIGSACSTSLVAIHLACRALLSGECDMALAGGVALTPERNAGYYYAEGAVVSPDGHCRAFDEKARGTIGGNGCGLVVLKALEEAEYGGDFIHAVVKSSVINNDGARKVGFTAPSIEGQVEAIQAAIRMAEIEPETITYVETHGTGTELGDPVEIEALKLAFATNKKGYCAIGSVKTNVGHLDQAAGVTGFIKTVLALKHCLLPPSLHFEIPNPRIDLIDSPFYISTAASEWQEKKYLLRAGVSSFGLGGTNAHVILEKWPGNRDQGTDVGSQARLFQLILLSARTESALDSMTENLRQHLKKNPRVHLPDVAYTLQVGRKAFQYRRMTVCSTIDEAVKNLSSGAGDDAASPAEAEPFTSCVKVEKRRLVFVFPEPGKPGIDGLLELYRPEPVFREEINRCFKILYPRLNTGDVSHLFLSPEELQRVEKIPRLLIFIFAYAQAKVLMKWGIKPQAMIGVGVGEYTAACLSGVFSLEAALKLVVSADSATTGAVTVNRPEIPLISALDGTWLTDEQALSPNYWMKNKKNSAAWNQEIEWSAKEPHPFFVVLGPAGNSPQDPLQTCLAANNEINENQKDRPTVIHLCSPPPPEMNPEPFGRLLLTRLGELWLSGVDIDWSGYYAGEQRSRIPLPTYPFIRESYWIQGDPFQLLARRIAEQNRPWRKPEVADWFYIPSWKRSLPLFPGDSPPPAPGSWLVFTDRCGMGSRLVQRLKQEGTEVTVVSQGEIFAKVDHQHFTINPSRHEDFHSLFEELYRLGRIPVRVVYLWGITPTQTDNYHAAITGSRLEKYVDQTMDSCFYSLVYLAQAIGKRDLGSLFQIAIITNGMQEVTGKELVCPEKAAVTGPVRVIPIEYRNIDCCSIDITLPRAGEEEEDMEIFFNQLQAEFAAGFTHPIIAYRCGYRWEPLLEFRQLQAPPQGSTRLKEGGVYLITGGLGGIGYVLAEDLAKVTDVKLVLIGRQSLPARDLWPEWLKEHDAMDPISQKIKKVNTLEQMGARVLVGSADVSDSEQMQQVKANVEKQWGPINGVIHAAGVPDGGVIPLRTRENTDPVLAPKVKGTLVLGSIFREVPLDFFISCSSLTSILVPLGQIGYCAANAVQDAFARSSTRRSGNWGFTGSINWDVWKEVGMGVEAARILQEDEGIADAQFLVKGGILNTEGVTVFHTVLHYAFPQTIISTRDLFVRIREFVAAGLAEPEEIANVEKFSGATHPRPELSTEYVAPRTEFEKTFADILRKFFGYEKVGIYDNFFEFGVTSLTIIRINGLLREAINKSIPIVSMFEYPTIHSLGQYLEQEEKGETLMDEESEESLDLESSEELLFDSIDLLRENE